MDTVMQLDAYGHQVKQAVSDAEETIQALEARLSRTREDSLVSVLNQNGAAQDLSAAEQALLSEALTFRDATGRRFRYYYRAGDGRLGLHRGQLPRPRSG